MKFVYKPSGTPKAKWKRWEWATAKMVNRDAELLEDLTDWTFIEWQSKFQKGSVKAVRAYLFMQLKKDTPGLEYDDIVFTDEEWDFELTKDEEARLAALNGDPDALAAAKQEQADEEADPKDE